MDNVEPHNSKKSNEPNLSETPLFKKIVSPQINNAALQIVENVCPQNENAALHTANFNAPSEPQIEMPGTYPASAGNTYSTNAASSTVENAMLHLQKIETPHSNENEVLHLQENGMPHSNQNEALHLQKNAALHPQKNGDLFENNNVVPQREENTGLAGVEEIKNVVPHQRENAGLREASDVRQRTKENMDSSTSAKSARPKKAHPKKSVKKIYSQKRNVVPLKLFVSPAEKTHLENEAKERGCSLSNFIRTSLGLAPNEAGRKKQNIIAAFDLGDLGFDLDFEDLTVPPAAISDVPSRDL